MRVFGLVIEGKQWKLMQAQKLGDSTPGSSCCEAIALQQKMIFHESPEST